MPLYTCISCRVSFTDGEIQRSHYKTEWHRYNLKRKVAEMPPVTLEVFEEKAKAQKQENEKDNQAVGSKACELCNKTFSSENAYTNHLKSKKHRENESQSLKTGSHPRKVQGSGEQGDKVVDRQAVLKSIEGENEEVQEMESDSEGDIEEVDAFILQITDCLFCPHQSNEFEENMRHMSKSHSFFIPDLEFVTDLHGLIAYLGEKLCVGFMCLYCNEKGRTFHSLEAVQMHMTEKGHCKMNCEGDEVMEFADFYDFSKSYPDYNPEDNDVPLNKEEFALVVSEETSELCLPSGARVGHRSLRHYYKQSLKPETDKSKAVKNIIAGYKALGWHGSISEAGRKKVRDERVARKRNAQDNLRLAVKANKFQTYFRPQVIF